MKKSIAWVRETVRGFVDSHSSLHAAGLTYFSVLALIPVLCFILVGAKVAHVDRFAREQFNAKIDAFIANVEKGQANVEPTCGAEDPRLAEKMRKRRIASEEFARQARDFSDLLFSRIDKFDVSRLGWFGLAMLLWTVVSSLSQVEISINEIWGVDKARPIWKKAYLYLFVAIVVPVLATLALSLPILNVVKDIIVATMGATWLTKWASDGLVWFIDFWLFRLAVALGFASLAFGYFLWVMPNRRVSFRHAWLGGLLTAFLFGSVLKICAVAQVGIAKSSAIYGSFAFLPIVLAWMYMSWQVILLGAAMVRAFAVNSNQPPTTNLQPPI